mgnify:CR=1 FL=1
MSSNEMTGGEALVRMLMAHEAGPMFGMGGFQLLPFYDAARRLGLNHNLINDERCAVFCADAYAKISGRVGLVDATGAGAAGEPRRRRAQARARLLQIAYQHRLHLRTTPCPVLLVRGEGRGVSD